MNNLFDNNWERHEQAGDLFSEIAYLTKKYPKSYFEEGGEEAMVAQQMTAPPVAMEAPPQEQMPPEEQAPTDPGIQETLAKVTQAVQQMLEQGVPEERIIEVLVEFGLTNEQAIILITRVKQESQASQEQPVNPENLQPGDPVEFMHGGELVKGKVKEIRDGKLYLY